VLGHPVDGDDDQLRFGDAELGARALDLVNRQIGQAHIYLLVQFTAYWIS